MRLNGLVANFEEVAKGPLWADFSGFVNHVSMPTFAQEAFESPVKNSERSDIAAVSARVK